MRKQKQFTEEQKLQLLKSPYIEKVHSNHLEYTLEFKQLAITQYLQGKKDNDLPNKDILQILISTNYYIK